MGSRTGGIVVGVCLVLASSAGAQVLPPSGPPPSQDILSAPSESFTYRANPSRNGEASEDFVFGPLERAWTRQFRSAVGPPLVVDGRVIVTVSSTGWPTFSLPRVLALDAATGTQVWSNPATSAYGAEAHIAYADGVVVSALETVFDSVVVRGFRAADGAALWTREIPGHDHLKPPVAHGGTVYVTTEKRNGGAVEVHALALASGATRWVTAPPVPQDVQPALDNARVFFTGDCGNAAAIYRSNGSVAWPGLIEGPWPCGGRGPAIVSAGSVFAGAGRIYDAVDGEERGTLPAGSPHAVSGNLGFATGDGTIRAISLNTGAEVWARPRDYARAVFSPLVVGGTVYIPAGSDRLLGFERSTGRLLSRTAIADGVSGVSDYGPSGVAAGARRLFVPNQSALNALAPVLRPGARGAAIAASAFDVFAGARVRLVGGVGPELRAPRPQITLEGAEEPGGAWASRGRALAYEDGTAYFTADVPKNTRYRVSVADGTASPPLTVFAYPRYRLRLRAWARGTVVAQVGVSGVRAADLRGRRVLAYFGSRRRRMLRLLGGDPLRVVDPHRATASVRFRPPRDARRNDLVAVCVPGLPRAGYGRDVGFAGRCGQRSLPLSLLTGRRAARRSPAGRDPGPVSRAGFAAHMTANPAVGERGRGFTSLRQQVTRYEAP